MLHPDQDAALFIGQHPNNSINDTALSEPTSQAFWTCYLARLASWAIATAAYTQAMLLYWTQSTTYYIYIFDLSIYVYLVIYLFIY